MQEIIINGLFGKSTILVGDSIDKLKDRIPHNNFFIIADSCLKALYYHRLPNVPVYYLTALEEQKSISTATSIYQWLLEHNADRSSFIVGMGGGITCDLAGFVASTFMRGVDFGLVPTTLLAQVDASVGGKNGVNLNGFKNIVGTITQPKWVLCDISLLASLPDEEYKNGLAEMVKHALILDENKFSFMERNQRELLTFNAELLPYLVSRSVQIKAQIVSEDERESGVRRKLNLGHTWGHAIETVTGISHGMAVSIGMAFAARFSVYKGYLCHNECKRIIELLNGLNLPTSADATTQTVLQALQHDKKRQQDSIHFVFIDKIGSVKTELIKIDEIARFAHAVEFENMC